LPGRVTGKLYKAVEAMVWEGASRKQAAQAASLTDHGLRQALRRPHVLAFYLAECEVLRTSGKAKRLHRLEQLAEQDDNRNAAVAAIKAAEQLSDIDVAKSANTPTPGVTIRIVNVSSSPAIDVTPRSSPFIDAGDSD